MNNNNTSQIKIADFNLRFKGVSNVIEKNFPEYVSESKFIDATIQISKDDLDYMKKNAEWNHTEFYIDYITMLKKISEWLPLHNSFLLHSVAIDVGGVGIVFSAHSGTGKTTHMRLWQKLLGDKMIIVNGDKPIVRFFDDEPETPYAYGTPWCGKEWYKNNMRTPLKHICFIERSETNFVEPMEKENAIDRIFNQVYMPKDPVAVMNTMQLIDRLLSCCRLWTIHCNMEPEAAEIAYNTIFKS